MCGIRVIGSCQARRNSSKKEINTCLGVYELTCNLCIPFPVCVSVQVTIALKMDEIQIESKPLLVDKDLKVCVAF